MYIEKRLKKFSMKNSKRVLLPLRYGINLFKLIYPTISEKVQRMSKISYASAIGSLMYAILYTQPNIAHAVSIASRYQVNLDKEHWIAV